jgi:hypothetical protein
VTVSFQPHFFASKVFGRKKIAKGDDSGGSSSSRQLVVSFSGRKLKKLSEILTFRGGHPDLPFAKIEGKKGVK